MREGSLRGAGCGVDEESEIVGASGLSLRWRKWLWRRDFVFGEIDFDEGCGWSDDANPRMGIGRSDTKVSSLIH